MREARRRPGRPKAAAEGATRETLLTVATRLFAEHGFEGVRVEAVARGAGVNKAMISYHFGGKRGLYDAVVEGAFHEVSERAAALGSDTRPAPEVLLDFVRGFAEMATVRRPNFPALFLREALSGRAVPDSPLAKALLGMGMAVAAVVRRGVDEGSLHPVDPLLTHLSLVGTLAFFFATEPPRRRLLARAGLPAPTPEAFVGHLETLIRRGLAAAPAARAPRKVKR